MPIVVENTGGWGCQCKAFRSSVPHQFLVDTVSRATGVTVERQQGYIATAGATMWRAWTDPENTYIVFHDPRTSGGWCKHIAACAADLVGGQLKNTYQAVKETNEECHELRKQNKRLKRMLETAQRKVEQSKTTARAAAL